LRRALLVQRYRVHYQPPQSHPIGIIMLNEWFCTFLWRYFHPRAVLRRGPGCCPAANWSVGRRFVSRKTGLFHFQSISGISDLDPVVRSRLQCRSTCRNGLPPIGTLPCNGVYELRAFIKKMSHFSQKSAVRIPF